MKNMLLVSTMICGIVHSSYAMMVQLPDSETLRERLYNTDFTQFIAATKSESFNALVNNKVPLNVAIKNINNAFADYHRYWLINIKMPKPLKFLEERQKILVTAVLQDNPKALKKVLYSLKKWE